MKSWTILLLLLFTVLGVNACFGGWSKKETIEPRVLPVKNRPVVEEAIKSNTVNKQSAVNHRGHSSGATRTGVSTNELRDLTETLLSQDVNNVGNLIRPSHQGKTSSAATDDKANKPLFQSIPGDVLKGTTIAAMIKLLDNYDPKVTVKETVSKVEEQEKNDFLNAIMNTQVMDTTEKFLKSKGLIKRSLRTVLDEIWFDLYGRSGRNPGSSGFEHVFIGELKNGKVSGFHNWVAFVHGNKSRILITKDL